MNTTTPVWLEFSKYDWILFGTPPFMPEDERYFSNTLNLKITVTDPYGETASMHIDIIVLENSAPTLISKYSDLSFYN